MNFCWQVVLDNIRSMQRMVRHSFSITDKTLLTPTLVKLFGMALLLVPLQFLGGCDLATPAAAPAFTVKPQLLSYDSNVPLSAAVGFESDQPVVASYKISDGYSSWQAHTLFDQNQKLTHLNNGQLNKNHLSKRQLNKSHRDFLLKFKPGTEHQIYVRITNAAGQTTEYAKPLHFKTPSLPKGFPQINRDNSIFEEPTDSISKAKQNEIALINVINKQFEPSASRDIQQVAGWLIAMDRNHDEVIWYMPTESHWHSLKQLQSGNLKLYNRLGSILEIDMLGNKLSAWLAPEDKESASNQDYQALPLISDSDSVFSQALSQIKPMSAKGGLIYDTQWVTRLIPPEFSQSDYQKHRRLAPDKALDKAQTKLEISSDIIVTEGDWRIVLESPEGLTEHTLTIDKQQGSIGLGYLDNYPVMVVLKGNRMQFKVRTSGAEGRAIWQYIGTLDDNGLEALGELRLLDKQNNALGLATPWQAYRQ